MSKKLKSQLISSRPLISGQKILQLCHRSLAHCGRPDVMALKRKRPVKKQDDDSNKRHKVNHAVTNNFNASSNRSPSESRIWILMCCAKFDPLFLMLGTKTRTLMYALSMPSWFLMTRSFRTLVNRWRNGGIWISARRLPSSITLSGPWPNPSPKSSTTKKKSSPCWRNTSLVKTPWQWHPY